MDRADESEEPDGGVPGRSGDDSGRMREAILESGRYRFYADPRGSLWAAREGKPWEGFAADQVILALFGELLIPGEVLPQHAVVMPGITLFEVLTATEYEDEDPAFPVADWQADVMKGRTRLGYVAWIDRQLDIYE